MTIGYQISLPISGLMCLRIATGSVCVAICIMNEAALLRGLVHSGGHLLSCALKVQTQGNTGLGLLKDLALAGSTGLTS